MSTNTQLATSTISRVTLRDSQSVDLEEVLGAGTAALLRDTLRRLNTELADIRPTDADWAELDTNKYELVLQASALPQEAAGMGVQTLRVLLELGVATVRVSWAAGYTERGTADQRLAGEIARALGRRANRAVNELLAVAVTQRLREKVLVAKQSVHVARTAVVRRENQLLIQTVAQARRTQGRWI